MKLLSKHFANSVFKGAALYRLTLLQSVPEPVLQKSGRWGSKIWDILSLNEWKTKTSSVQAFWKKVDFWVFFSIPSDTRHSVFGELEKKHKQSHQQELLIHAKKKRNHKVQIVWSGGREAGPTQENQTSGAVTLICVSQCEFVRVTVSTCIKWRRAELQTSRSVKIKVKNTSTIKTGCSYLMSWKPPWEPSLGGFVVVRQFQWPVLVPT